MMTAVIFFVIVTTIIAIITTIIFITKGDPNYRKSAKRNTMNLTIIYVIATILSLIALAFYIWLF
ncbi:hypothetical protein RRV45_03205 [Bacillus sp. DTU_2020_1000418_1_SI_GHA_SEK_038]|uniref:hypothetical protein n=1 Tax=Bacillus sp. DTU_2020_1000418_1_SI_GHA_SEK_038 TaxID=3077585 RepID=UPI0028EC773A|nr:hypothetical protein [Bacillus sp. DTU_2020_1000418_1_SI_GHA_SEK_038]WNS76034.1 hypothetical protein RRV45_03205 [Bacillus sp. DTU_2020_1000418_1_SI_GHA_SEK_038]